MFLEAPAKSCKSNPRKVPGLWLFAQGIANRDLKLENLLLDRDGHDGTRPLLKICDFGYSKVCKVNQIPSAPDSCSTVGVAFQFPVSCWVKFSATVQHEMNSSAKSGVGTPAYMVRSFGLSYHCCSPDRCVFWPARDPLHRSLLCMKPRAHDSRARFIRVRSHQWSNRYSQGWTMEAWSHRTYKSPAGS